MTGLLFVTDVHGSEKCFLKFLNSWKYYPVQILVLGGDITGKGFVPIIRNSSGHYEANLLGEEYDLTIESEVQLLEKDIRFNGFYPYRTTPEEVLCLNNDPDYRKGIFIRLIVEQVERWEQLAEDRLKNCGVCCYVIPGNDDIYEIDNVLNSGISMINVNDKVIEIAPGWMMLGAGYSNHTPWNGPREIEESEILGRIDRMVAKTPPHSKLIFNFHCPPHNTNIDTVQLVDKDFRPIFQGINPLLGPGGSTAVRQSIENYHPCLGLHGHIHEGKGVYRHKNTISINPGSEYTSGILKGALITLGSSKVESYFFIDG